MKEVDTNKIVQFIIYTHLLIAGAAVAQCLLTYKILNAPYDGHILGIIGASTLIFYNLSIILSKPKEPLKSKINRTRWFYQNIYFNRLLTTIATITLFFCLIHIKVEIVIIWIIIGIISFLYYLPIYRHANKKVGLRHIPGLKIIYITTIWLVSTIGIPVLNVHLDNYPIHYQTISIHTTAQFIFIFVCTLPFDIRDIEMDQKNHLKTIPVLLGRNISICITYILLLIHLFIICLTSFYVPEIKSTLFIIDLLVILLIRLSIIPNPLKYIRVYLLDLMLIIQGLTIYFLI